MVCAGVGADWSGFWEQVVDDGGCASFEAAVWPVVVVVLDEVVDVRLEFVDGVGGVGSEPLFEGLLEAFDFAGGGGVVWSGVFLFDVEVDEECFELVATAAASGKAGGVNHAVVGQDRSGKAVLFCGFGECFDNDEAPDTLVGEV